MYEQCEVDHKPGGCKGPAVKAKVLPNGVAGGNSMSEMSNNAKFCFIPGSRLEVDLDQENGESLKGLCVVPSLIIQFYQFYTLSRQQQLPFCTVPLSYNTALVVPTTNIILFIFTLAFYPPTATLIHCKQAGCNQGVIVLN